MDISISGEAGKSALETEAKDVVGGVERKSTRAWAVETGYDAKKLFNKVCALGKAGCALGEIFYIMIPNLSILITSVSERGCLLQGFGVVESESRSQSWNRNFSSG